MTEAKALMRIDPQVLLTKAVEGNASIETLERLVALAKDVREVQAREAWYAAMSDFQRRCPEILKTKKADIVTAKGFYSYRYAALDDIMSTIRPLLGELGLSIFWSSPSESPINRVVCSCRVAHVLGHVEESGQISLPVPDASDRGGGNPLQRIGSALSYARRYSLMSIMGISPEEDDDAGSAGRDVHPGDPDGKQDGAKDKGKAPVFPFGKHKDQAPMDLPLEELQKELTFWERKTADEENPAYKAKNQKLVTAIMDAIATKTTAPGTQASLV